MAESDCVNSMLALSSARGPREGSAQAQDFVSAPKNARYGFFLATVRRATIAHDDVTMEYPSDDDELQRGVDAILHTNARLAAMVPRGSLGADPRYVRALPAARPPPPSILDDILMELAAAAAEASSEPAPRSAARTSAAGGAPAAVLPPPAAPSALPPPDLRPPPERIEGLHSLACPICLDRVTRSQYALLAPCFHPFCYACIRSWLRVGLAAGRHGSCPSCRGEPVALLFSIRGTDSYRFRLLSERAPAVVGDLDPDPGGASCGAPR